MAESIDSKARPLVEVYDPAGRRLVGANGPDAVTDFVAPNDGEFYIRVAEFTYTSGGPTSFYRLTVTTNPWIDSVYPPMVEPGKPAQVTLYGRNLPGGTPEPGALADGRPLEKLTVTINAPAEPSQLTFRGHIEPRQGGTDGFEYRLKGPGGISNPILLGFAQDKIVLEKEPNDKPDQAMELPVHAKSPAASTSGATATGTRSPPRRGNRSSSTSGPTASACRPTSNSSSARPRQRRTWPKRTTTRRS